MPNICHLSPLLGETQEEVPVGLVNPMWPPRVSRCLNDDVPRHTAF
ncbi:Hypothetical protein Y17_3981 [Pectobacterium wasabiae CFBP 3304]|nr:Hypothetical protein Y17_3981 [Pectobacterium wasabiae CFBP 3304]